MKKLVGILVALVILLTSSSSMAVTLKRSEDRNAKMEYEFYVEDETPHFKFSWANLGNEAKKVAAVFKGTNSVITIQTTHDNEIVFTELPPGYDISILVFGEDGYLVTEGSFSLEPAQKLSRNIMRPSILDLRYKPADKTSASSYKKVKSLGCSEFSKKSQSGEYFIWSQAGHGDYNPFKLVPFVCVITSPSNEHYAIAYDRVPYHSDVGKKGETWHSYGAYKADAVLKRIFEVGESGVYHMTAFYDGMIFREGSFKIK